MNTGAATVNRGEIVSMYAGLNRQQTKSISLLVSAYFAGFTMNSSSSSSSSNTVQGSVLLPHYRTLEVRPGRIS